MLLAENKITNKLLDKRRDWQSLEASPCIAKPYYQQTVVQRTASI